MDKHLKCVQSINYPQQYSTLCLQAFDITILLLKIELSSNDAMHSKGAQFTKASINIGENILKQYVHFHAFQLHLPLKGVLIHKELNA